MHPIKGNVWLIDGEYLLSPLDESSHFAARTVQIEKYLLVSGRFVEEAQLDLSDELKIGESFHDEEEGCELVRTRLRILAITPLLAFNHVGASLLRRQEART